MLPGEARGFQIFMLSKLRVLGWLPLALGACAVAQDPPELTTTAGRFQYYLTRTYSWQRMSWLAADTAFDQLTSTPEWGGGMGGYGCHYASGFGRRLISNSIEFGGVLLWRQDTRFRPSHRTGLGPRVWYAARHAFLATGNDGSTEPAYARFAGIAGGALIAPAWHRRTLSPSRFGQDLAFSTLDQIQNSLLTEFTPDIERVGRSIRKKVLGR